eukprot:TRINITY_DN19407_c0_g1_i1.p1 TRINITY_DN19407_c0_g1~~TRINITY_DN19407_c0_g1_i1.p1  ORF type:complete len:1934 (+),score=511.02 TRINITY_DN19407_c0_g1_i1:149-5950(+)
MAEDSSGKRPRPGPLASPDSPTSSHSSLGDFASPARPPRPIHSSPVTLFRAQSKQFENAEMKERTPSFIVDPDAPLREGRRDSRRHSGRQEGTSPPPFLRKSTAGSQNDESTSFSGSLLGFSGVFNQPAAAGVGPGDPISPVASHAASTGSGGRPTRVYALGRELLASVLFVPAEGSANGAVAWPLPCVNPEVAQVQLFKGDKECYNVNATSMGCLGPYNKVRVHAFDVVNSQWFGTATLVVIIMNTITLAMDIPETEDEASIQDFLYVSEIVFQSLFTVEVLVKIVALGFVIHPHAYLRTGWNRIDFLIVVAGFLGFVFESNVTVLRLVRVVRPLRTISRVAAMRTLMNTIMDAFPTLLEILFLLFFLLGIYAIMGMGLFSGTLHNRCYVHSHGVTHGIIQNDTEAVCGTGRACSVSTNGVYLPQKCLREDNAYYDEVYNFDHIASALLLVFKVVSLDDWPEDMHKAQDAKGFGVCVYFLSLVLLGSYFCINLVLATLSSVFDECAEAEVLDGIQLGQVLFQCRGEALSTASCVVTNPGGDHAGEGCPNNVIDSDQNLKWFDFNLCELHFQFPAVVNIDAYRFVTAKDAPQCDPVQWSFEGFSREEQDWVVLHETGQTFHMPDARSALTQHFHLDEQAACDRFRFVWYKRRKDMDDDNDYDNEPERLSDTGSKVEPHRRSLAEVQRETYVSAQSANMELSPAMSPRAGGLASRKASLKSLQNEAPPQEGKLAQVVNHPAFGYAMLFFTLLNVVCMACDHHGIEDKHYFYIVTQGINFWCSMVFTLELVFKLIALGPKAYFKDGYNVFDCVLVLASLPDVIQTIVTWEYGRGVSGAMSAFRVCRLARMARAIRGLEVVLQTTLKSIMSVTYLFCIMLLVIFIYSILGLQLFHSAFPTPVQQAPGDYHPAERSNFATLPQSLLTVFVVITGESWCAIMKEGMTSTSWLAGLYFISLFLLGNYLLLNLVIAIVIYNFSEASGRGDDEREEKKRNAVLQLEKQRATVLMKFKNNFSMNNVESESPALPAAASDSPPKETVHPAASEATATDSSAPLSLTLEASQMPLPDGSAKSDPEVAVDVESDTALAKPSVPALTLALPSVRLPISHRRGSDPPVMGESFGYFHYNHPARKFVANVVLHPWFNWLIMFIIFVNVVFLAIDNPSLDDEPALRKMIEVGDYIFTALFVLEALAKMFALGVYHPKAAVEREQEHMDVHLKEGYLNDPWNCIDLVVCVTALAGIGYAPFKLLRSLRALRFLILSEAVRVVLLSVLVALPHIAYVLLVCSFIWLVFGILGVALFKGQMYYCSDLSVTARENCTGDYVETVMGWHVEEDVVRPREWIRTRYHFDHVGSAILTLFEVAIGEGWAEIMYAGVDTSGSSTKGMVLNQRKVVALYFVAFVIVGGFFAMNLFVGALVEQFSHVKSEKDGTASLTDPQRQWLDVCKIMNRLPVYKIPGKLYTNPILQTVSHTVRHRYFEHFIMSLILLNVLAMALQRDDQSDTQTYVLNTVFLVFALLYAVEAVLKIVGFGPSVYFADSWCRFDFILVVVSFLFFWLNVGANFASALRIFRIFRLIKRAKSLQKLFQTLVYAIPSLSNLAAILIVVFFIFGVIGVSLFGRISLEDNGGLNHHVNFQNLGHAIVLLFTIATTETWSDVMDGCMITEANSGCSSDADCGTNCCGTDWALFYFIAFMIMGSIVAVNLFVTVLLDQFIMEDQLNEEPMSSHAEIFATFRAMWVRFDQDARETVSVNVFLGILRNMPQHQLQKLGMSTPKTRALFSGRFLQFLAKLAVPLTVLDEPDDRGHVHHVSYRLAQRAMGMRLFELTDDDVYHAEMVSKKCFVKGADAEFYVHHLYALKKVLKGLRANVRAAANLRREGSVKATASEDSGAAPLRARSSGNPLAPPSSTGRDNRDSDADIASSASKECKECVHDKS